MQASMKGVALESRDRQPKKCTLGYAPAAKPPVRCGRPGFGGRAPALSPKAGRPGPPRVRGTRPCPADLRRFTEGPRIKSEERRSQSFCGRDCRALLFPG